MNVRKHLILFLLIFCFALKLKSQNETPDSLLQLLKPANDSILSDVTVTDFLGTFGTDSINYADKFKNLFADSLTGKIPPYIHEAAAFYADSLLHTMSRQERIAQLLTVAAWSNKDSSHINYIRQLISLYNIGGLCFFQGNPVSQALLTNDYQQISKHPLLISIDGEWGLNMRLQNTVRFPRQMTLSAMHNDALIYAMGREIGRQCHRMGIHVNFAPDVDINNNMLNPVIGSRSFGDDRETVWKNAFQYMKGMQEENVIANIKHFPGHGNTSSDSHFTLPVIGGSRSELDSTELYPFKKLVENGVGSVMIAHLNVPSIESQENLPTTLSKKTVTDILRGEMNFQGLVFTDAMNMKGVADNYKAGNADKMALIAGNDILLMSESPYKAIREIHLAIENCELSEEDLNMKVMRLLMLKYWCGLNKIPVIDTTQLLNDLNNENAKLLQQQLYESAVTVLKNEKNILPLAALDTMRIAAISIGEEKGNSFHQRLQSYAPVDIFSLMNDDASSLYESIERYLNNYNLIIISLHNTTMKAEKNFGLSERQINFITKLMNTGKVVFTDFGNAYTLSKFSELKKCKAIVLSYEDMSVSRDIAAQVIFGGIAAQGKLPVNVPGFYVRGEGINTIKTRLKYSMPADAGMDAIILSRIDSIAKNAIANGAIPGCQVMIVKDEKVVYQKSFGQHTYTDKTPVANSDVYDIASVTKIMAAAPAVMKIFDDGDINLNSPLSKYLTELRSTNKKSMVIKDMLAHQAGLVSWIPFWKNTMSGLMPDTNIYHKTFSDAYPLRVANEMYLKKSYSDSLRKWIDSSPMAERGKYVYSDLGPIYMKILAERITQTDFDLWMNRNFYLPLGLTTMGYNPRRKFDLARLIPTEDDKDFRKQLLKGDVHDPSAALMGGVGGNAGIFSNANDVAVMMQMFLNGGEYGGRRYLSSNTVALFTSQQFPELHNRRGLLFDKPEMEQGKASPASKLMSASGFGHQGFTGTCTWADPEKKLIYVFLSNRIHPDATNEKLVKLSVRSAIQDVIYESIRK